MEHSPAILHAKELLLLLGIVLATGAVGDGPHAYPIFRCRGQSESQWLGGAARDAVRDCGRQQREAHDLPS